MEGVHVSEKGLLEYGILMKKSTPPPFLLKTFLLVDDPDSDTVISWNDGGTAFVVWQPAELSRDLLPTFFKHCNFSSFVRQLNTYGFRKVATSRWEFRNDKFQRGKKELLGQIRRRKSWAHRPQLPRVATPPTANPTGSEAPPSTHDEDQRSSSTSSSELNILADENKRLKKENGVLSSELSIMKNKCKELLDLVALYTNQKEVSQGNDGDGDDDDENYEKQPKLFGVRLQVQGERERKRKRSQEFYETATLVLSQSCK